MIIIKVTKYLLRIGLSKENVAEKVISKDFLSVKK